MMFRNYLKIALRNLLKQKIYTLINILGLSIGVACCILIYLFVQDEWSYDKFHSNADHIHRVVISQKRDEGGVSRNTLLPHTFPDVIREEVSGVEAVSGFIRSNSWITYEDRSFLERFGLVNNDFLKMFSFPLINGDAETALLQPDGVVLTTEIADKFFPENKGDYAALLGNILHFQGATPRDHIITGVMENLPTQSSLQFGLLIPLENQRSYGKNNNDMGETTVYVQLKDGATPADIETALSGLINTHLGERIAAAHEDIQPEQYREHFSFQLQPLTDIYLNQEINSNYTRFSNPLYSYILAAVALLVLFIACINFTTLSIGRSTTRAKEVGVRKTLGARRQQLMQQFWGEALLLTAFAVLVGLGIAELFLPAFNNLSLKSLKIFDFSNWNTLWMLLGIMLLTGIMAGSYPALVLSRFTPISVFKGNLSLGKRNRFTRGMVLIQYVLSTGLIIIALVIVQQLNYMRSKDTGFKSEAVVVVNMPMENTDNVYELYKQQIIRNPNVVNATGSDRSFTNGKSIRGVRNDQGNWVYVRLIRVDADYLATMDLTLLAGRNISDEITSDATQAVVVNEEYIARFGWTPDEAIGKSLIDLDDRLESPPVIAGVVRNFHIDSMREKIEPLILHNNPDFHRMYRVLARIRPEGISATVDFLKQTWEAQVPGQPFQFSFLDEELDNQYRQEEHWSKIIGYASFFAILISCMGLLGLVALAVARRTKEIGIRKVLGATSVNIVSLISKEFLILVAIANIIAWPLAFQITRQWLENFAYRIELSPWIFVLAAVLVILVALLTVAFQAIRAAITNPVKSLRYE